MVDAKQLWQTALERVRARVSSASFTTWFKPTEGIELSSAHLSVFVPSSFACEHVRQRFGDVAARAVAEVYGGPLPVTFTAVRPAALMRSPDAARGSAAAAAPALPARRPPPASREMRRRSVSAGPRATHRARQALLETPVRAPLSSRGRPTSSLAQPALPLTAAGGRADPQPTSQSDWAREPGVSAAVPRAPRTGATPLLGPVAPEADAPARHVFETFVVGTANRLAFTAAQQIAAAPGQSYNPLFIYGGTGLGKTHLLLAIAQVARQRGLRVCYVPAERFANDIIEAIRHHTTPDFRAHYRAVDVLLVDDVQFIAGKESTEEEFFHTFNTLHEANRQIVLSSDRTPKAMHHLHDRLRSRFEWGLLADIQPPDFEHRLDILRVKAAAAGMLASEAVLVAIARPDGQSVRALEGALNRVVAYAAMLEQPLEVDLVRHALQPLGSAGSREVSSDHVLATVARHYGVTVEALRGKARDHAIVWPRQVAMYLLREETPASLGQIGLQIGGRDHSTVLHGCTHVSQKLMSSDLLRRELEELRTTLHS